MVDRCNLSNYVNIIGFQLEKVHTGVIKWCLESEVKPNKIKAKIINDLYSYIGKEIPFDIGDVQKVNCYPEYSFGRKVRIDLLIEIITSSTTHTISCEMKVDSDPYTEQLDRIVTRVEDHFINSGSNEYLLVLLGSSVVMKDVGNKHGKFNVISNRDLIGIFSHAKSESYIVSEWVDSLVAEVEREELILEKFKCLSSEDVWDKSKHISLGYRPYFSTYYYLYQDMKKYSSMESSWNIYSGGNNPVMNLSNHWRTVGDFEFYWEFNYLEFCFKVRINKNKVSHERLNELRHLLYPILERVNYNGFCSQKRYGDWNTIYKWRFDIEEQSVEKIFNIIENEILSIYDDLTLAATDV